jgi:4-hydroxybenzoate polyprenyltransferase
MMSYLRLVRLPNLLIVILTMVLVRYCLILPAFRAEFFITGFFPSNLSDFNFFILVASVVLISAAGYIINDYFDIHIDQVNRPGKNIVGKKLSAKSALVIFVILSVIGLIAGFYVAIIVSKPGLGLLHVFAVASLWMYSSFYKRRLFIGNVIVALLCAISVMITGLFEPEFYKNIVFLTWFTVPAFLLTLVRELIKDIEDIDGDELSQCKTAPIVFGIRTTKFIILSVLVVLLAYISHILYWNFFTNKVINFWYMICIFLIPVFALSYLVMTASEKKDFYYASLFTKLLMVGGISSMFFFWKYFLID